MDATGFNSGSQASHDPLAWIKRRTLPRKLAAQPVPFLLACLALSLLLYTSQFLLPYGLFAYAERTPIGFPGIVGHQPGPASLFLATFLVLFGLYALAYRVTRWIAMPGLAPLILAGGLALALPLAWTYPMGAQDQVNYAVYGESLAFHGANPLVTPLRATEGLALGRYAIYRGELSPYGPLWTWIEAAGVWMVGTRSLAANLLLFKGVTILAYALQAVLIYLILRRRRPALAHAGLLAFAWNPLVLYEFAANGHNDALMMALVLLGIFFWDRGRPFLMVTALTAAMLVKVPTAYFLPLFLVAAARPWWPGRRFWLILVGGGLLATALVIAAYLSLPGALAGLWHLTSRANHFTHSLPAVANLSLQMLGAGKAAAQAAAQALPFAALVVWWLIQTIRTWRAPGSVLGHAYAVMVFMLFFAMPWFQPWYVTWIVALAALFPFVTAPAQAGLFSLTVVFSYVVYGFVWSWRPDLGGWGHNLGITLMAVGTSFTLPWVQAAWLWLRGCRRSDVRPRMAALRSWFQSGSTPQP